MFNLLFVRLWEREVQVQQGRGDVLCCVEEGGDTSQTQQQQHRCKICSVSGTLSPDTINILFLRIMANEKQMFISMHFDDLNSK